MNLFYKESKSKKKEKNISSLCVCVCGGGGEGHVKGGGAELVTFFKRIQI